MIFASSMNYMKLFEAGIDSFKIDGVLQTV